MSLLPKYLPQATPFDTAEDPPGSIDPLGSLGTAERIAEVLFPAFTARMWRPRLLTFTAMAALVAERIRATGTGAEDGGLAARLAFERLFVSAVVRQQEHKPDEWGRATRRLPGSMLARKALRSGDTPLGQSNFLKGQAINGPFGVVARLARHLGIVDEDDRLGCSGEELLLAYASDKGLLGLLDEDNGRSTGRQWLAPLVKATADHLSGRRISQGWSGWQELAERLRPDTIGRQERDVLRRLLDGDPVRKRCIKLLSNKDIVSLYRSHRDEREVLKGVLRSLPKDKQAEEDRAVELAIQLADAHEQVASLLEVAFKGLLWGLTHRGGQAKPNELEADRQLQPVFQSVCEQLPQSARRLRGLIERIPMIPQVSDLNPIEPLDNLALQAEASVGSKRLIEQVINRHRDVQKAKGKGMWIERGERWTLMPSFGWSQEAPPKAEVAYLHTFRVPNAYSFMSELGLARLEVPDGEA